MQECVYLQVHLNKLENHEKGKYFLSLNQVKMN